MSSRKVNVPPATSRQSTSTRSSFISSTRQSFSTNATASSSKSNSSTSNNNLTRPVDTSGKTRNGKSSFLGSLVTRRAQFSKKLTATMILYFLMVYYGVKDAYLVDIHSFRRSSAVSWLADCCQSLGLDSQRVMVLMLDSDCFLVNVAILRQKLQEIEQNTLDVLVINLDADPVTVQAYVDMSDLQVQLTRALPLLERYLHSYAGSSNNDEPRQPLSGAIKTDKEPYAQIGGPFFAGLLLGYPCVYLAKPEVDNVAQEETKRQQVAFAPSTDEGDNNNNVEMKAGSYQCASGKLSYSILSKVTCSVRLALKTDLEEFSPHFAGRQIPVLEFTYPQYLMESLENEDMEQLVSTAIEKFRGTYAKKYDAFDERNELLSLESRFIINEEVVSTEVVSL